MKYQLIMGHEEYLEKKALEAVWLIKLQVIIPPCKKNTANEVCL